MIVSSCLTLRNYMHGLHMVYNCVNPPVHNIQAVVTYLDLCAASSAGYNDFDWIDMTYGILHQISSPSILCDHAELDSRSN
jgi:hypothetical protein